MARELLNDVMTNKTSDMHQIIGQMIHGDLDDENNWQMVEYVFDKLKSEGCGLSMRFYNTLIEALWWLGQKERAARVLNEATKRGLFPELFRRNKLLWSVDVHRMWPGGACTAISVWLNDMEEFFHNGEELPQLASVVVVRGQTEKSSITRDLPVAKAAYSFLKDTVSSSFSFPGWNKGRIVCQKTQLKRSFSSFEPSTEASKGDRLIPLSNSPISLLGTHASKSDAKRSESVNAESERRTKSDPQLMTSNV